MPWVYILLCADGTYYVGSTTNLDRRIWEHNQGTGSRYTAKRRPVKLVFSEEFDSIAEAYAIEKQIHHWSHAKRKALIDGNFEVLRQLSKKNFQRKNKPESDN